MREALRLARQGVGRTAPNPPVGAILVRDGQVIGGGYHPKAGAAHAEIFALRQAGELARGSDLYVTLEPCSHQGRTGPCAQALIEAGVKRVFVGVQDPNPQVAGRGISLLQHAGIEVEVGILDQECRRLIAPFARQIHSGLPYTIYKTAMTLDGKTATASGDSRWISGEGSRLRVHRLRDRVEAIMIGIGTLLNDDSLLNTRLPDANGRDPLRVVVDSRLQIPLDCKLLHQQSNAGTLVATTEAADKQKIVALEKLGVEVLFLPETGGQVTLLPLWQELGRRNVQRLLLEGGATLAGAALQAGLIDQLMVFVAPKLIGGSADHGIFAGAGCLELLNAVPINDMRFEQVGEDLLICGEVERCSQD